MLRSAAESSRLRWTLDVVAVLAAGLLAGCRAHPLSLAITLVGDAVDDQDLRERKPQLLGRGPAAADGMFGPRHDTLVEVRTAWKWLIYPEPGERFAESFYVAEVSPHDKITGLFKCKRNIDGLEDVQKTRALADEVFGKAPAEAQAAGKLPEPLMVMRSEQSGAGARIYDVRNWTHTRGRRYCVLVFGPRNLCDEVRFIGVTAH